MIGTLSRLCIPPVGCARAGCPMESAAGIARMAADVSAWAHAGKFGAGVFTTSDGSGGIGTNNARQFDRLERSGAMADLRERCHPYFLVPQSPIRSADYGPASPGQ